ncbi:hypothetical protein PR001_g8094 [Phytophthora rubi]|uniref:Uncharacterized protein n=2 Tax=Phytophthora rubi TaxID=129364 RepID=A0A6A3NCQ8_9STRA|nr:hypothetical protein PR002_g8431 [Phytophthora rubi]KAE9038115.1 hypothetical protein PR001_g8094 [Phytophthora rubi]
MSMNIRGVETVDICERTNTGKNSLMNALSLTCEYDSGSVASHRQVRHFKLETERAWPQDPVLFTVSLGRWSGGGLNFKMSECGDNLLVGQRRLVCIARALLKNIVVVYDTDTDSLILVTIRDGCNSHRMHCNKIAVMPAELLALPESNFTIRAKRTDDHN